MKKKKLHTRSFTVIVNIGIGSCRFFFILFLKYAPQSVSFSQCLCSDYFMCVCVCACARGLGIFASNVSRLWLTLQMYTNTHHTHSTHLFPLHVRAGQEVYIFCCFRYFCCWMQNTSSGEKKKFNKYTCINMYKKHGIEMDKMQPIFQ